MESDTFEQLEHAREAGGASGGFDFLSKKFREEKNYPSLFETRLMQKRFELGLDPIQIGTLEDVPAAVRPPYERAFVEAAREVGGLFLADGDVARAWPYFRAIGESGPVAEAIERAVPGEDME